MDTNEQDIFDLLADVQVEPRSDQQYLANLKKALAITDSDRLLDFIWKEQVHLHVESDNQEVADGSKVLLQEWWRTVDATKSREIDAQFKSFMNQRIAQPQAADASDHREVRNTRILAILSEFDNEHDEVFFSDDPERKRELVKKIINELRAFLNDFYAISPTKPRTAEHQSREWVVRWLEGSSYEKIAQAENTDPSRVKTYIDRILAPYRWHARVELAKFGTIMSSDSFDFRAPI